MRAFSLGDILRGVEVRRLDRFLVRGEAAVAPTGLVLALLVTLAIGASAWWSGQAHAQRLERARVAGLKSVAVLLQQSTEALLADGDLSSTRRLLVTLARQSELTSASISLLDGQVFAATDPGTITLAVLPGKWPQSTSVVSDETNDDHQLGMTLPLNVPGRGEAKLTIEGSTRGKPVTAWRASAGTATIAMFSLTGLLLVYRHTRSRLRAMGEIHEGLRAIDRGETALDMLRISGRLGVEADAWNQLIGEVQKLRDQEVADRTRRTLGTERRSGGTLTAACDVMPQGLLLIDQNLLIVYANGASAVFLEAAQESLVGQPAVDHFRSEAVLDLVRDVNATGTRRRGAVEVDRQRGNGEVCGVLRFTVRATGVGPGGAALVIIEDITQQRAAEDARHAFVAQATHELRTPLTNIRLSAETVIDADDDDQAMRLRCLNVINHEARRLERIVSEMLSVAEIEAGAIRLAEDDLPLAAMFEELKNDNQPQADAKGTTLCFDLPPKLPTMCGDRDKIMLALHNLVGNALKYAPNGKQVVVTVEVDTDQLLVHVCDSGIGIAEDDRQRIFEKFYRANDKRVGKIAGSGLGLTLAREVVRLHGGDIKVKSALDEGSTFTLSLPVPVKTG